MKNKCFAVDFIVNITCMRVSFSYFIVVDKEKNVMIFLDSFFQI